MIKDSLNQEKISTKEIEYGIILDGGILIDDRIISSLLNSEEDFIYIKGKNIETNCNNNLVKNLACKIKINTINLYSQANSSFSFKEFIDSSSFNKSSYHSTDEITTYKSDMRRNVPISVYVFQHPNDFKLVKKLL